MELGEENEDGVGERVCRVDVVNMSKSDFHALYERAMIDCQGRFLCSKRPVMNQWMCL